MLRTVIRQGFFHLLSANFLIQFLGFGTLLLIPQFVSQEELGSLKAIQTYTGLFMILAGFGYNNSVLKLCSEVRPETEKLYYLKVALKRSLVTTALSYGLMALLVKGKVIAPTQQVAGWLLIYALILPFDTWTLILSAYLQALKKIREMARAQLIVKLQSVVVIIAATWRFGFAGFVCASIIAYAVGLWPFLRQTGLDFLRAKRVDLPPLFREMSTFSVMANGINTLGRHADILILDMFSLDRIELGLYALAKIFLNGSNVVTATMQRVVMPLLSERADDEIWFRRHARIAQLQTIAISIVVAIGLHFVALVVVRFYDADYSRSIQYLDILLLKYVLWSSFAILGVAMMSLGVPRYNLVGTLITTPVGLVATYLMLEYFGTIGVAWAQVVANAAALPVLIVVYSVAVRRHYRRASQDASPIE